MYRGTDGYGLNPIMLKHLGNIAKSTIKRLFNLSLQTGHWCWEQQNVSFLRKSGKDSYLEPGSYRPISISSYIGKLLERILEHRLREHCQFFNILDTPRKDSVQIGAPSDTYSNSCPTLMKPSRKK